MSRESLRTWCPLIIEDCRKFVLIGERAENKAKRLASTTGRWVPLEIILHAVVHRHEEAVLSNSV